ASAPDALAGAGRYLTAAPANLGDVIIGHHHVGVVEHLLAAHGDDSRAAQHNCALWRFARHLNDCLDLLDVRGLLFLLLLGGLVSRHLLLRGALRLVRRGTARRNLVSLSVLLLFVRFFLLVLFLGRLEGDSVKGLAEEARTYRPGDGLAVVGPVKIVGTDVGQFLERDARRV